MGKLAGRFYDASGQPSAELRRAEAAAARAAADEAARAAKDAAGGPPVDGDPCQLRRDAHGGAYQKGAWMRRMAFGTLAWTLCKVRVSVLLGCWKPLYLRSEVVKKLWG